MLDCTLLKKRLYCTRNYAGTIHWSLVTSSLFAHNLHSSWYVRLDLTCLNAFDVVLGVGAPGFSSCCCLVICNLIGWFLILLLPGSPGDLFSCLLVMIREHGLSVSCQVTCALHSPCVVHVVFFRNSSKSAPQLFITSSLCYTKSAFMPSDIGRYREWGHPEPLLAGKDVVGRSPCLA